jgi:hypothetical protein
LCLLELEAEAFMSYGHLHPFLFIIVLTRYFKFTLVLSQIFVKILFNFRQTYQRLIRFLFLWIFQPQIWTEKDLMEKGCSVRFHTATFKWHVDMVFVISIDCLSGVIGCMPAIECWTSWVQSPVSPKFGQKKI